MVEGSGKRHVCCFCCIRSAGGAGAADAALAALDEVVLGQLVVARAAAIAAAIAEAGKDDIVLIAGKGHETDQDIAGVKLPFSDVDEALGALRVRAAAGACA